MEKKNKFKKVSSQYLQINDLKIFNTNKLENQTKLGTTYLKASCGWMRIIIKQNKIKLSKRKCGKERTAEDCIVNFEEFINKVQFYFLQPTEDDGDDSRDTLWGRLPI